MVLVNIKINLMEKNFYFFGFRFRFEKIENFFEMEIA